MPANYTLYRFGNEAIRHLPSAQQRVAQRFRRVYNGGLVAQDLFFYFRPTGKNAVRAQYGRYSRMTGKDYFAHACQWLKDNPSEAGEACLYGMLAHYCLMSCLAPLIREETRNSKIRRVELEVELDRYLLSLDDKTPAHRQDTLAYLKMTRGECVTVSGFFEPLNQKQYFGAYKSALQWSRRMTGKGRGWAKFFMRCCHRSFRDQLMPDCANHKCLHLDKTMLECYERALEYFPAMARQLTEYREKNIPLGEEFDGPLM